MRIPRQQDESFHQLLLASGDNFFPKAGEPTGESCMIGYCTPVNAPDSAYEVGGFVGKNCVQVGRTANVDDQFIANDAEVYEKWSQALASANSVANQATRLGLDRKLNTLSLILPIVVVPDGLLWKVDFDDEGRRTNDPSQTERCSFFVNQKYFAQVTVSHLEFVTLSGLLSLCEEILKPNNQWFTHDTIVHSKLSMS